MDLLIRKVTTIPEFIDAIRLRVDTFIVEQKCAPGWEPDELDKSAEHYIAVTGNEVVGTLRVRGDGPLSFKIERMATARSARKLGTGRALLQFVVAELSSKGARRVWMQAQVQARGFYEKCVFEARSEAYDLYGISHVDMEYGSRGATTPHVSS